MKQYHLIFLLVLYVGCSPNSSNQDISSKGSEITEPKLSAKDSTFLEKGSLASLDTLASGPASGAALNTHVVEKAAKEPVLGELEKKMMEAGLIDIQTLAPNIQVDLKYATADNFLNKNVYGNLHRCYLQPEVARMLANAQQILEKKYPGYFLHVFDGARPRSVQFMMWAIVKGTPQQGYVASPKAGSMHNYGASVDLSLATEEGELLDMGTSFDFFGDLAQPRFEDKYRKSGELTETQVKNRRILRSVMKEAGFHGILNEWWHFNAYPRDVIKKKYKPVE